MKKKRRKEDDDIGYGDKTALCLLKKVKEKKKIHFLDVRREN